MLVRGWRRWGSATGGCLSECLEPVVFRLGGRVGGGVVVVVVEIFATLMYSESWPGWKVDQGSGACHEKGSRVISKVNKQWYELG